MLEKPAFLQGIYSFRGSGLQTPRSFEPAVSYKVPFDKRSQMVYLRAGNSSTELICLILTREGKPVRYFPVGARSAVHVPLAVLEDMQPEVQLEVLYAAPEGETGSVVIDIGLMEF